MVWKGNNSGIPTAKSLFDFLNPSVLSSSDSSWAWIWKLGCSKKIRFFIWLVTHDRILTNQHRVTIGIAQTDACPKCSQQTETVMHLLRDCPKSRCVWDRFLPPSKRHIFFSCLQSHWVKGNATDAFDIGRCNNQDWSLLFVIIL